MFAKNQDNKSVANTRRISPCSHNQRLVAKSSLYLLPLSQTVPFSIATLFIEVCVVLHGELYSFIIRSHSSLGRCRLNMHVMFICRIDKSRRRSFWFSNREHVTSCLERRMRVYKVYVMKVEYSQTDLCHRHSQVFLAFTSHRHIVSPPHKGGYHNVRNVRNVRNTS